MASALCKVSSSRLLKPTRACRARVSRSTRSVKVSAKYGDESKYFDLSDLANTTGSWDMYGVQDEKRYPALQEEFFLRAGEGLSRREAIRAWLGLVGISAIALFGAKGSIDAGLPITKGPDPAKTENGKGGKTGRL